MEIIPVIDPILVWQWTNISIDRWLFEHVEDCVWPLIEYTQQPPEVT